MMKIRIVLFAVLWSTSVIAKENGMRLAGQNLKRPGPIFELQIGHHTQETVRFELRTIEEREVHIVSYLINGEISRELVFPKRKFDTALRDFYEAFPPNERLKWNSIEACGQNFVLKRMDESETVITEFLCVDKASSYQQQVLSRWWRSLRKTLGI